MLRSTDRVKAKTILSTIGIFLLSSALQAQGQTLDQQYDFYLDSKCANLGFARDPNRNILPDQAGPNLFAYCNGRSLLDDLPPGVTVNISSSGGGAGAAAGRDRGNESATRRRQEQLRDEDDSVASPDAADFSLLATDKLGVFVSLDFSSEHQQQTTYEAGMKSDSTGIIVGADYRLGSTSVIGMAINQIKLSGDFSGGGNFDNDTRGFLFYGSWLPNDEVFVDFNIAKETAALDTQRVVGRLRVTTTPAGSTATVDIPFSPVDGHSDSRTQTINLRGGYDFLWRELTVGPRLGLARQRSVLDGYSEIGTTPMGLQFKQQTETSLQTSLGMQGNKAFSLSSGVISVQLNLDWLHEFKDDQRNITAQFAEDLRDDAVQFTFLNQAPDRNWFNVRIATAVIFSGGLSAFVSLESNFGHDYIDQYSFGLGLRKAF